jgi:outer membrane protein
MMRPARRLFAVLAVASASAFTFSLPAVALADGATQGSSGTGSSGTAQSHFAIIDTRRAIMETEEGLRVQANLKKLFDQRQVELSDNEQKLTQEQDDIAKEEKAKGPNAATEQKKEQWRMKAAQLQETLVNYQREMARKESEMTNPMLQKMIGIVKRVATQEGFDMVVDKAAVPYFRNDLDITDKIIQLYNADGGAVVPADKTAPAKGKDGDVKKPSTPVAPPKDAKKP